MDDTYVLIFAFDPDGQVLLRRKKRPDWQHELWNGLGGQGNYEDTSAQAEDLSHNRGHWPRERYVAVRKFREEADLALSAERLRGNIIVPFPPCTLHVFWVDLTTEEAKACFHARDEVDAGYVPKDQEYNHWFDDADVIHMDNGDTEVGLVSSTYELIRLIQSLRHRFPEEGDTK